MTTWRRNPAYDLIPVDPATNDPPGAGLMNQPAWSTDVFTPAKKGTKVQMLSISTNAVPAGIYTVWLEGHSGNPYFQARRYPTAVRIGGAVRDFSFENSNTCGTIASVGGSVTRADLRLDHLGQHHQVGQRAAARLPSAVDYGSFTDCAFGASSIGAGQLTLSATSVTPSASGNGALSNLTINSFGLAPGCYTFMVRGNGTNGDGQPVTHLQPGSVHGGHPSTGGNYVDIIGFAVFQVSDIDPTPQRSGRDRHLCRSQRPALRRAQKPRLVPW